MATGNPAAAISFRQSAPAVFLIIYAAGALIYGHSLLAPFYFDDLPNITENPHIRLTRLTGSQMVDIFSEHPFGRVLSIFTFAANYYFHQYQTTGYRLVNLLIHVINGWLVFCLTWQTLRLRRQTPFIISLLAGLLWLVQPAHTQSVTYIVQRMNSMATMFYLLALVCYIQGRQLQQDGAKRKNVLAWFAGCGLAGLLGLTAKQTVATLPMFIFLYEWFFFQNLDRIWLKRRLPRLGLVMVLCGGIAAVYLGSHPIERISVTQESQALTPVERLLTQPQTVLYYLSLLACAHPNRLTLDYDFPLSGTLMDPAVTLPAFSALIALLFVSVVSAGNHRLLSFAILWFLGNLAIESSIMNLALIFEHRTYLPSIFPIMAATACLMRHIKSRPLAIAILGALIACNSFWTYQRNITWQDPIVFWQDACAKSPNLTRPRNNYGMALAEAGRSEEAIAAYEKAILLSSGKKAAPYNNLGILYYRNNDINKARENFSKAIAAQPTFAKAYMNLGSVTAEKGDLSTAIRLLETAVALDPEASSAHNALGKIYYESGRTEEAIRHCRRALALNPDNVHAENNLGAILLGIGEAEKALPHLARVAALSPDLPEANINIGIAYSKTGNPVMAVFHLFRAVFLAPEYPAARLELGLFLSQKGKYQDAKTHLEKALALQQNFPEARLALEFVLEKLDLTDQAIVQYKKNLADDPDNATAAKQLELLLNKTGNMSNE